MKVLGEILALRLEGGQVIGYLDSVHIRYKPVTVKSD